MSSNRVASISLAVTFLMVGAGYGQRSNPEGNGVGPQLITVGGGPGNIEQQVAALDFSEIQMRQQNKAHQELEKQRAAQRELVDSGQVSALDLAAPGKAVNEYNQGIAALRNQKSPEAVQHFQKAVTIYPKFVSAHNALGMAFSDLDDVANAKSEFEAAADLDQKYGRSYVNLSRLAVSQADYKTAQVYVSKAASLRPNDVEVLLLMAYAQNGTQQYSKAIETVARIHQMPHDGKGNAHYVAAAAAVELQDAEVVERELMLFLKEDPANPLAPVARMNLQTIAQNRALASNIAPNRQAGSGASAPISLANSARLKAQLEGLDAAGVEASKSDGGETATLPSSHPADTLAAKIPDLPVLPSGSGWTIRKGVDEVALFFAVSSHGHMINDLELANVTVRDDGKPPEKILQFAPQSKLPLRVGLLIDVSGSVHERFGFEKYAAARFLEHLLTNPSDFAFVAGFSTSMNVVQDFSTNHTDLEKGISSLKNGGGTSLFDAVSFACGKLAAYPETERVAKVLIVLSDGEDNSSHTTLRRAISDAETSGVTIYAISTKESGGDKTDADKVLEALAERSGGEALFPQDNAALRGSFDKLRDIIRSRYLLAYKPAEFVADGKYRAITVSATRNGSKLQVHSRKGYRARVAPAPDN
jgi:VWFA-related protein